MYRYPWSTTPIDVRDWVLQKEEVFRQAYELVRRNATAQQRRRNSLSTDVYTAPLQRKWTRFTPLPCCSSREKSKIF